MFSPSAMPLSMCSRGSMTTSSPAHDLTKGMMRLIDGGGGAGSSATWGRPPQISGGSAANTAAGVASFGGKAAYFGKVKADQLGEHLRA